jgi:hypothetical protein
MWDVPYEYRGLPLQIESDTGHWSEMILSPASVSDWLLATSGVIRFTY